MDDYTVEATAKRMIANMHAIEQAKPTMQEVGEGLNELAFRIDHVWQLAIRTEALWQARIDGPIYRTTPLLGRFRWYRRLRVWLLRRSLH